MHNVTFGAQIKITPYLKEGINYAKKEASPQEQNLFLNCLKFIKDEKYVDTFSITGSQKPHSIASTEVKINGMLYSKKDYSSKRSSDDGYNCCIISIPDFIERFYGKKILSKLGKTKDENILKCEEIQKEMDKAVKVAKNNLNSAMDEFLLNSGLWFCFVSKINLLRD